MADSRSDTVDLAQQFLALQQEVTELRKKNHDLHEQIKAYSSINTGQTSLINNLIDKVPFGIVLMDEKSKIIQANHAAGKILDIPITELVGHSCSNYFDCFNKNNNCPVLTTGQDINFEKIDCLAGDKYLVHSAFFSDEGTERIVVDTFMDITDIKRAELELIQTAKAKDEFLGMISHELRTPLNSIQGYSSLLEDELNDLDNENASSYLTKIQSAGNSLINVIDDLLELSELTAGKIRIDKIPIDLEMIITQLNYRLHDKCELKGNTLKIEHEDIGPFEQDLAMLMKILYELLLNANKFTDDGKITLSVNLQQGKGNDRIIFKVSDTGHGMDDDTVKYIFDAFKQADSSMSRSYEGLGLGLSIVEKMIKLIGGEIEVESHNGVGSTFTVSLPYLAC